MKVFSIDLKEKYPFLDVEGATPVLTAYLAHDNMEGATHPFFFVRPAMIVCPGGGYAALSGTEAEPAVLEFLRLGFNVFLLEYSTLPVRWPQALRELAATVDLIHANAKEWNIDTNRIAVSGFSAGGHLAASYCTVRNCEEITSVIDPKPVQAAVLGYPVIGGEPVEGFGTGHTETIRNLCGNPIMTEEVQAKFNLDRHVSKEITPPTFMWHTCEDTYVPINNAFSYAKALTMAGIPFEFHVFPNGVHGQATSDIRSNPNFRSETCKHNAVWLDLVGKWLKLQFDI